MATAELDRLELQVSHLMQLIDVLRSENAMLRQKMMGSMKERTRLQHKNERALRQVKQLIKQLKEGL